MGELQVVGADTMVFIYWNRDLNSRPDRVLTEKEVEMVRDAGFLRQKLTTEETAVLITPITISEILCGIPVLDHSRTLVTLQENFDILLYDEECAMVAARLWSQFRDDRRPVASDRNIIKNDAHIIACYHKAGVRLFYTFDTRCKRMAESLEMRVPSFPTHHAALLPDVAPTPQRTRFKRRIQIPPMEEKSED